ncbi:hypothetical protein ACH4D4_04900 [Streptomyces pristinaespiralis]|uniref:hypothetical protein n=1 Tax=Streptomyces pristinaespiralis TaxID=38300 RepID=UPI0037B817ED
MSQMPDRLPTYVGQPQPLSDEAAKERARQIADAVDEVLAERKTFHRDDTPVPLVGSAPPVPQPGRPPMSSKAVDDCARMLCASGLITVTGGVTTAVLWASGYADPAVVAIVFGAPVALVLALSRLMRRAKGVLPSEHHHHYRGPVHQDQRNVTSHSSWLGKTTNNL